MTIQIVDLQNDLFEELSDEQLQGVVGGTGTTGQVTGLVAGIPDAIGSELQQKRYAEQIGGSVENILTGANLLNGTAGIIRSL